MAKQSLDESEAESVPEIKKEKSETREEPSLPNENPPKDIKTEEQNEIEPARDEGVEASIYTEQDLTEEGVVE